MLFERSDLAYVFFAETRLNRYSDVERKNSSLPKSNDEGMEKAESGSKRNQEVDINGMAEHDQKIIEGYMKTLPASCKLLSAEIGQGKSSKTAERKDVKDKKTKSIKFTKQSPKVGSKEETECMEKTNMESEEMDRFDSIKATPEVIAERMKEFIIPDLDTLKKRLDESTEPNSYIGFILNWSNEQVQYLMITNDKLTPLLWKLFAKEEANLIVQCLLADKRPRYPYFWITSESISDEIEFLEKYEEFKKLLRFYFGLKKDIFLKEEGFLEHVYQTNYSGRPNLIYMMVIYRGNTVYRSYEDQVEDLEEFSEYLKKLNFVPELKIRCDIQVLWSGHPLLRPISNPKPSK